MLKKAPRFPAALLRELLSKFLASPKPKTKILDCELKDEVLTLINDWENRYLLNENI